jgi:hypothetical protein
MPERLGVWHAFWLGTRAPDDRTEPSISFLSWSTTDTRPEEFNLGCTSGQGASARGDVAQEDEGSGRIIFNHILLIDTIRRVATHFDALPDMLFR